MITKDYLFSSTFINVSSVLLEDNAVYFYSNSTEERSHFADALRAQYQDKCHFVGIEKSSDSDVIIDKEQGDDFSLKSMNQMKKFLDRYKADHVYIDSSGLNIRVCAALLRHAIAYYSNTSTDIKVVYVEPEKFKLEAFRQEGEFHDLSENISGIDPLPGFNNIIPEKDENDILLVAFLGFEGGRFAFVVDQIVPPKNHIIPIIGVAGFRAEYPFVAYAGNKLPLQQSKSWNKIRYAKANSIADAYFLLKKLQEEHTTAKLKVAPIGTKPHTIASILYAIKNPGTTELVFDNPIRKKKRTDGIGKISITSVTKLLRA
jgi:hypothetical protein